MKLKRFGLLHENAAPYPEDLRGLSKDSVTYHIGTGEVISHIIAISKKLNCKSYIIDPTPHVIKHVAKIKSVLDSSVAGNLFHIPYAVGLENSTEKFYESTDTEDEPHEWKASGNFDHSLLPYYLGNPNEFIYVEVKTIESIMNELNHPKIDLLEIDLGGMREVSECRSRIPECEVMEDLVARKIFPKYISVDLDFTFANPDGVSRAVGDEQTLSLYGTSGSYSNSKKALRNRNLCLKTINLLEKNNYTAIHNQAANYTFMRN